MVNNKKFRALAIDETGSIAHISQRDTLMEAIAAKEKLKTTHPNHKYEIWEQDNAGKSNISHS